MPRLTLPNNSLSTKFATPRFVECTSFSAHEFSTTVSSLLVVHNSTKQPVFTRLPIYVQKVSFSDFTMRFFAFSLGTPTETLQFVFFHAKTCLKQGPRMLKIKKRTTQLCCRWLSNSRAHSACIQTTLLDGNQLLFSVTKLILISSSIIAEVNASERFLEIKI